jgi:hydroxyethylthiazole kinase-like uncharacterized protein yjeF
MTDQLSSYFKHFHFPDPSSHKGQNGKVLLIGGSELFHAASKWSLDVLSKCVDMVFYSSVPSNNKLIEQAKTEFWNGIVIPREDIENYVVEADCILIGPGMTREQGVDASWYHHPTSDFDWNSDTYAVTNYLVHTYPDKKWVIDAGALQMLEPIFLNHQMILTPHRQELLTLLDHVKDPEFGKLAELKELKWLDTLIEEDSGKDVEAARQLAQALSQHLGGATFLIKGRRDVIIQGDQVVAVAGGNAGMTKGGTGDVLAGLVAALYPKHEPVEAAVMASYVNKRAGDQLYQQVGPFFSASDLVTEIPRVLWQEVSVTDDAKRA